MSAISYDAPEEEWAGYPEEEAPLPGRPRRTWWGRGTALLLALLVGAIGFYVGIRVEKGQVSSSTSSSSGLTSALASRFGRRAGAGGAAGTATTSGAPSASGASRFGGAAALFGGGSGGAGGGASFGTVSSVNGDTIFVQTATGNVVKVTLSSATKVTKSQGVSKSALRPGDTVVIQGVKGSSGAISATSVSDSGNRSTSTSAGTGSSSSSSSGSSAVNSLFGSGGGG